MRPGIIGAAQRLDRLAAQKQDGNERGQRNPVPPEDDERVSLDVTQQPAHGDEGHDR